VSWKNLNSAIPINIDNRNKLCPSGWKTLDEVFLGGFPSGNVIQILGKASTGKTQLCLSTAVSSARL
jgi:RecA/RadA recombinase